MKYSIGIQTFSQIIEQGFVYVDKTDMVYSLATEGVVSRVEDGSNGERLAPHTVFYFNFNGIDYIIPNALCVKLEGY
ncbi:hypothetical protein EVA_19749 [gut metagenome]|uniref:AAA-ATPase-like domain-containing protein n=1 Tax=gut metagenome TaxID=749906 RepID=J9FXT6_9ZZZZ